MQGGIHVSLGKNLGNATMPIGVLYEDCSINGTGFSGPLQNEGRRRRLAGTVTGGAEPDAVVVGGAWAPFFNSGEVRFQNLSVANASGGVGLVIKSVPAWGWAKLIVDGLLVEDVGFDNRDNMFSPINIFGANPNAPPRCGAGTTPTGAIKILNAVINDRSARPFLRMVDRFGFRGVEVSGTVVNPFACSTNVEAGFPLRDLQLARVSAWGQRQRQR